MIESGGADVSGPGSGDEAKTGQTAAAPGLPVGSGPSSGAGDAGSGRPARLVDALGRACPAPIIMLARAVAGLGPGSEVELLSDDPAALVDTPAWCRLTGHEYLGCWPLGPATADQGLGSSGQAPAAGQADAPGRAPGAADQPVRHRIRLAAGAPSSARR